VSKFDFGTGGFILAVICIALLWYEIDRTNHFASRIYRIEDSLRAICAGEPRIEACALLGLPLDVPRFEEASKEKGKND